MPDQVGHDKKLSYLRTRVSITHHPGYRIKSGVTRSCHTRARGYPRPHHPGCRIKSGVARNCHTRARVYPWPITLDTVSNRVW